MIATILLTLLWIFLGLLGLLLLITLVILFTPVKIGVIYPQPLTVYVKWNGIKLTLYPPKQKKRNKSLTKEDVTETEAPQQPEVVQPSRPPQPSQVKQQPQQENQPPVEVQQETPPKKAFGKEEIQFILKLVKAVLAGGNSLLHGIVFERFWLNINVGDEDKAEAATTYGAACAVLAMLNEQAERVFKFKDKRINFGVDFLADSWQASCNIIVYMRPVRGIVAVIAAYKKLKEEGIDYGQLRRFIRTSL